MSMVNIANMMDMVKAVVHIDNTWRRVACTANTASRVIGVAHSMYKVTKFTAPIIAAF